VEGEKRGGEGERERTGELRDRKGRSLAGDRGNSYIIAYIASAYVYGSGG
jgi:hypothetical protein